MSELDRLLRDSFPRPHPWGGIFWAMFSRYRWWRRLRGGLWQRFDQGRPGHPYLQWIQTLKKFDHAVETEDYR